MVDTTRTTWSEDQLPVSLIEVAEMAGVSKFTARAWSNRKELPEVEAVVSGRIPVWQRGTIQAWLEARTEAKAVHEAPEVPSGEPEVELIHKGTDVYVNPSVAGFERMRTKSFTVATVKTDRKGRIVVTVTDKSGKLRALGIDEVALAPFPTKAQQAKAAKAA